MITCSQKSPVSALEERFEAEARKEESTALGCRLLRWVEEAFSIVVIRFTVIAWKLYSLWYA